MALEVAVHGIRINTVQPGFAPGSEINALSEDHIARDAGAHPPRPYVRDRTTRPPRSSGCASGEASFVTGTTLAVDGGRTAGDFTAPAPRTATPDTATRANGAGQ